jgi:Rrf2 family protein
MGLINKNTDYAIRALCYMAERTDTVVSATELSNALDISWSLIRRILQELSHEGYVKSFRGKGGGFTLERPAYHISVLELINVFQGFIQFNRCRTKGSTCSNIAYCELRKKVSHIEQQVIAELKPLTIASLLSHHSNDFNQTTGG